MWREKGREGAGGGGLRALTHHRVVMCVRANHSKFLRVTPLNVGTYFEAFLGTIQTRSWCFTIWVGD